MKLNISSFPTNKLILYFIAIFIAMINLSCSPIKEYYISKKAFENYNKGNYSEAIAYLTKAINHLEENAENKDGMFYYYLCRGYSYAKLGKYDEALKDFHISRNDLINLDLNDSDEARIIAFPFGGDRFDKENQRDLINILNYYIGLSHYKMESYEEAEKFIKSVYPKAIEDKKIKELIYCIEIKKENKNSDKKINNEANKICNELEFYESGDTICI